jgi:hypothetical protein
VRELPFPRTLPVAASVATATSASRETLWPCLRSLASLRGATVAEAEIRPRAGRQVLRLRLASGAILAI